MANTPLGIPLVDFDTDQPNGAGQINAAATAIDPLITARLLPAARMKTGHGALSLSSGNNPVAGPWPTDAYNIGDIAYSNGIFTVARAGLYYWGSTVLVSAVGSGGVPIIIAVLINGATASSNNGTVQVQGVGFYSPGGAVALNSGDTVQVVVVIPGSTSGMTITPDTFSLFLVG